MLAQADKNIDENGNITNQTTRRSCKQLLEESWLNDKKAQVRSINLQNCMLIL
jgi:hypothetical protein